MLGGRIVNTYHWTTGSCRTADDDRAPSRLPTALVLPPRGIDVIAPGEQRPEERDLGLW
jgi:hypothetical protein